MTRIRDIREYTEVLRALGDLTVITDEVDEHLELGAFIRRTTEVLGPARLFENIVGAPGFRVLGAPAALSSLPGKPMARVAMSWGLPPESTVREIVDALARAVDEPPIPTRLIEDAPVFANQLDGEEAVLDRFPTPLLHPADGGRYVNTFGTIVVSTPDGSFTNWSIARIMMLDGRHMTGVIGEQQHIGMVWKQWAALGKPMPFAIVQGPEPAVSMVAATPLPDDVEERAFLGGLFGEPVDVVRCRTNNLEVPASAEVLIEGTLSAARDVDEGPMGEFAGYMPKATTRQPTYTINAISYRDNAIWPAVAEGYPADEYHTITGTGNGLAALLGMRKAGLPIATASQPFAAANHITVMQAEKQWRAKLPGVSSMEFARRVGRALETVHSRTKDPKIYLLDDDFDAGDPAQLLWAMATRLHPTDRQVITQGRVLPLLTCYSPEELAAGFGPKVIHDGLLPEDPDALSAFSAYPQDVQERVLALEAQVSANRPSSA